MEKLEEFIDSKTLLIGGYPATELALNMYKNGARIGAEWQKEQMYSEEEVLNILDEFNREYDGKEFLEDWFTQFKKK